MKKLLLLLPLLLLWHKPIQAQQLTFECVVTTSTPCNSTSNPGSGTQGTPIWQAGGYLNTMFGQIYGAYGVGSSFSTTGILTYQDLLTRWSGTMDGSHCPSGAGTMITCGGGGGGGTPGGSNGQIQYNNAGIFGGYSYVPQTAGGTGAGSIAGANIPVWSGTITSGDCVKWLNSFTVTDAGSACGGTSYIGPLSNGLSSTFVSGYLSIIDVNRSVSGTTDSITCSSDLGKTIQYGNASATSVTLPQATGTCGYGFWFKVENYSTTGTVTINPITSTINSQASLVVGPNRGCMVATDNSSGSYDVESCTALVTGGGGTPGGSSGQIQYNGSGAFAGATNSNTTLADIQATTTFTVAGTGCTPSAHAGGPYGGTITLASGPCTAVTVTINGATGFTAPNGYHCNVGDKTTQAAGTWIPSWAESASSTTTATLPIPAASGATDVISFNCDWY